MPDHETYTQVNLKYTSVLSQWGKQDAVFNCPTAIIYKFYLPGAMEQASMSSPAKVQTIIVKMYGHVGRALSKFSQHRL